MFFIGKNRFITLSELSKGKINDETVISVSRLAVNLRIVELSSSTSRNSQNLLRILVHLSHTPSSINHRKDIESHYYLSAKETRMLFKGMKNAPINSFSISSISEPMRHHI